MTTAASSPLEDLVDSLAAASAAMLPVFPTSADFDESANVMPWRDLVEGEIHRLVSSRSVITQHGVGHILTLQKPDGKNFEVWSCGLFSRDLPAEPGLLSSSVGYLFIRSTGSKTSKSCQRKYNTYQLLQTASASST